jgi:hypothetical protein
MKSDSAARDFEDLVKTTIKIENAKTKEGEIGKIENKPNRRKCKDGK